MLLQAAVGRGPAETAAASTGALLALLEPLTGTILAALVLGQHLSASGIAGAAVLAVAVIITILTPTMARASSRGRGERGEQFALPPGAQPGLPGPIEALLALPGQHVVEQLVPRAVS